MKISTVGIDLAKNVFQVHGIDEHGKAVLRKRLRRNQVAEFFVNLPPCLIGMETCGSAHHWARKLEGMAHTVRLMAPQHVKRYVKTNKNDAADAEAICEAVVRLRLPGEHGWRGTLVCDDFSGCKACFELGVTKAGCLAHARRKLHELWVNHGSPIGEQELKFFGELCAVEREVAELMPDERRRIRQEKSRKVADALQQWLAGQRQRVPEGSATARAIDYSLKRWQALTRYIDDGDLPADNNWVENQIQSIAIGRSNWLFAGSLRAGQRAAVSRSADASSLNLDLFIASPCAPPRVPESNRTLYF
ncbi:transposase [Variovorax paradoxus]